PPPLPLDEPPPPAPPTRGFTPPVLPLDESPPDLRTELTKSGPCGVELETAVLTLTLGTVTPGALTLTLATVTLATVTPGALTLTLGTLTFGTTVGFGTLTLGTLTVGTLTPPALALSAPTTTAQRATETLTSFVALILSLPGLEVAELVVNRLPNLT